MNTLTSSKKRTLLFDFYSVDDSTSLYTFGLSKKKIEKLKQKRVKTIFIISSHPVYHESYLRLVRFYQGSGFEVKSIHIEDVDVENLPNVKNAAREIYECFKKGSCQVVSYGESYAGTLISCVLIYGGENVEDAIDRSREINSAFVTSEEEFLFVYNFQRYIRSRQHVVGDRLVFDIGGDRESEGEDPRDIKDAIPKRIIQKDEDVIRITEEDRLRGEEQQPIFKDLAEGEDRPSDQPIIDTVSRQKERDDESLLDKGGRKEGIRDRKPSVEDEVENSKFGRFYLSIRFKLISIISFLIVLAISLMIFLATHFFKGDNEIRIQENNLKISEVIALKVKSDFVSLIEKSRLIVNAMIQNTNKQERKRYSELILGNDKDFIFSGIAVMNKRDSSLNFVRYTYNDSLMNEIQVSRDDIKAAHRANNKIFVRSFDGETIVQNVSQVFRLPVLGLCYPFQKKKNGGASSVLVSYINLDKFLKAFRSTGITKAFMVNDRGDIIAHPDSAFVLSGGSKINLPIVKSMIKSTLNNGQTRYKDENGIIHLGSFNKIGFGGCGVIATVEEKIAFQEVYNIQRRNIYLMIITLTVVILIVFFFGKTLTTPIIRLLYATKKIKGGDYHVDIRPSTSDEIGELTNAFIDMGRGLEEREKIKTAFGKFVNPELADMVVRDEIHLGGERKTVAILFSDIRSFTAISERLEPEEVVDFLNEYMTLMVNCIDQMGGVVDKFIGDAIMAVWGVPVSKGNDTENAINGALLMRKALIEFNKGRGGPKRPTIKIGCGINVGPTLAGQIGSENRMEYTVIGDAVNLASRIEALNKPFGTDILVSEETYNLVRDVFAVEKMKPIKVKGKEEPQQIYAVLGRIDDSQCPRTIDELRALLDIEEQPFRRRREDLDGEEVKYEVV
ncbi:MAG: adenylate/guanylate cyclase domain-containing protein [Spirochaetota bacterium]|nr:adenylate/guanylate cyclase domain-containing protein [Spirochaetota bacterium]